MPEEVFAIAIVSICATIRFSISLCADSRLGAIASISSMKSSAGACSV